MTSSIAEIILGYGFTIVLFAGLPAVVFLMIFLPGLMHTTGETIGASEREAIGVQPLSKKVPLSRALAKPLTMANTA